MLTVLIKLNAKVTMIDKRLIFFAKRKQKNRFLKTFFRTMIITV